MHYNPWTDPRLIVKYNITDISEPIKLYNYVIGKEGEIIATGAMMFDKIEIDDGDVSITSVDTAQGTYQFATAGEHTVKYTLKDPTFIGTEYDEQTDTIKIGAWFYGCETAIAIEIPNSVTTIGDQAFTYCSGLTSMNIPNSVTSIGGNAFSGCSGLTSVTIGNSVTRIGGEAFRGCGGLTSLAIPNSVNSIEWGAFSRCTSLTSVTIPNSVTSIGSEVFAYCTGLTSVTIGNSVTSIGDNAFMLCSGLTSIKVESGNTTYDSRNDCNAIIETASNTLVAGCKNTVIPNSVTSIEGGAFWGCTGLTSVTIPSSVTSIGSSAFRSCSGLTSIICNATTAPTITSYTFIDVKTNGTLTVPTGSTGYDVWMGTGDSYLGKYGWTKVEQ